MRCTLKSRHWSSARRNSRCATFAAPWWSAPARRARAWRRRWKKSSGRNWRKKSNLPGWVNVPADCRRPAEAYSSPRGPAGGRERADGGRRGGRGGNPAAGRIAGGPTTCASACSPAAARPCCRRRSRRSRWKTSSPSPASQRGRREHRATQYRPQATQPDQRRRARPGVPRGRLVSLIISDVLGDPLDLIASGPTVEDRSTPEAALAMLQQFAAQRGRHFAGRVRSGSSGRRPDDRQAVSAAAE